MAGEGHRLGVRRGVLAPPQVPADHGLGSVVDDLGRHPAELGEGPPVAVVEGGQILAGDEAAERVTAVGQRHVEAGDAQLARRGGDRALVAQSTWA